MTGYILTFIGGIIIGAIAMALISRKNHKLIEKHYQEAKKQYEELKKRYGN